MKKLYVSLLAVITALAANAQFTQSNHAPASGDTWQTYQCDSTGIVPGSAGTGKMWNFASITTHSNMMLTYTVAAVSGNTSYPTANIVSGTSASSQSYFNSQPSELTYLGGNITVSPVMAKLTYTSVAYFAIYPMNFNVPSNSLISGSINVTAPTTANGTFDGSCNAVADASGTLVLPGATGTFTNVTRMTTTQVFTFSVVFLGTITGTVTQVNYEYYQAGIKAPIFSISTASANVPTLGAPSTQTIVTRNKNAVGSGTVTTVGLSSSYPDNFAVYPNPAGSFVNIATGNADAANVHIYDITGKMVVQKVVRDGKAQLDVSDLNAGLYIYSIKDDKGTSLRSGKLTVSH
jgi:hypothetical protein